MGLAEPRKRVKLSHDPRNLAWSTQSSSTSYGHRLMTQQGWAEGQALGARHPTSTSTTKSSARHHHSGLSTDAERLAAARVGILFKDDNLGLGAKKKGGKEAVESQRTGLDAFQGLLGRLNGKGEETLREEEKKVEERRLEMFFRGRWGGMVFVRGGVLVGSRGEGNKEEEETEAEGETDDTAQAQVDAVSQSEEAGDLDEPQRRKEEKRQRKEEKRKRKEEKAMRKATRKAKRETRQNVEGDSNSDSGSSSDRTPALPTHKSPISQPPDEPVSSAPSDTEIAQSSQAEKKRKRKSIIPSTVVDSEQSRSSSPSVAVLRNGRHLLRGRNILAKKMVLVDAKGLDQIFMR